MKARAGVIALVTFSVLSLAGGAEAQVVAPYSESFDGGLGGWVVTPPTGFTTSTWAADYDAACDPVGDGLGGSGPDGPRVGTTGASLNFNNGVDYSDSSAFVAPGNFGTVTSPVIDVLPLGGSVLLRWVNNYETEWYSWGSLLAPAPFDNCLVTILDSGGTPVPGLTSLEVGDNAWAASVGFPGYFDLDGGPMGTQSQVSRDISAELAAAAVTSIMIRFTFSSEDAFDDAWNGWFIDDVMVTCATPDLSSPTDPTLLSPPDASFVSAPVALDWTDCTDTSPCGPSTPTYDVYLELAVNPPTTLVANTAVSTFVTGALPVGTYFWRVQARDASGNLSAFSSTFSFTIEPAAAPSFADTLHVNESVDGAQSGEPGFANPVVDQSPAFSAIYRDPNTVDDATSLRFQVSLDPTFLTLDFDSGAVGISPLLPKDARCPDLTINVTLLRDTVYFWRIQFTDAGGLTGGFCPAQSFRIGDDFEFGVRGGSTHHGRRCYVATAAFGSESSQVRNLAGWRERQLESSASGRLFSRWYGTAGAKLSRAATASLSTTAAVPGSAASLAGQSFMLAFIALVTAAVLFAGIRRI